MQAIKVDTGVVLGSWLFTDGTAVYVGPKYLNAHYNHSDSHLVEKEDETLTLEQNKTVHEILKGLGR